MRSNTHNSRKKKPKMKVKEYKENKQQKDNPNSIPVICIKSIEINSN